MSKEREGKCCNPPVTITDYGDLTASERERFQQLFVYRMNLPFVGVRGKLARNDFNYFTDTSLAETGEQTRYDFEIRAFGGIRFTNHRSVALTLQYQHYYDAGDLNSYSRPRTNGVTQQADLYETAPTLTDKVNVLLEYRTINRTATLAFNPYLLADFNSKQIEARAQFYFFRKKDDDGNFLGLNGGAFVGYRTSKDFTFDAGKGNLLLGVFFAPTFDLNRY